MIIPMNLNEPLEPDCFYHIYNKGINGETLFKQDRNYSFFLQKYAQYLAHVVDTFAYCLLNNHFHLLIRVKDQAVLNSYYNNQLNKTKKKITEGLHSADFIVSKQFARLFSSYSQSINRSNKRTGSLIETPFKRRPVANDVYLTRLIWYIHFNPQKHGFLSDFRDYPHSSYQSHLQSKPTKLSRDEVLAWFGNLEEYKKFHKLQYEENEFQNLIIEH
jgi:putative transposase